MEARTRMTGIVLGVPGVILLAAAIITGATHSAQQSALDADKAMLADIREQIAVAEDATASVSAQAAVDGFGGSAQRVADDREILDELAERILNWDSHASYTEAREITMRAYGLSETDDFMLSFLPEAPITHDSQGNEYTYIDAAGLNSHVEKTTVTLLGVDAVDYTYLVLADVKAKSSDGRASASNVASFLVTVDGEGQVVDLSGFASTKQPTHSG